MSDKYLTLDHLVWPAWMLSFHEQGILKLPLPLPDRAVKELNSIDLDMTRAELEAYLRPEGGIHTRMRRAYVTRACEYIHVMVEFILCTPQEPGFDRGQWAGDRVRSISEPYLANFFIG
jgi:hypothetical protein